MHLVYCGVVLNAFHLRRRPIPGVVMYRRFSHHRHHDDDDELLVLYDDDDDMLLDLGDHRGLQDGQLQLEQLQEDADPVYYSTQASSAATRDNRDVKFSQPNQGLHRTPIDNDVELLELHVPPDTRQEEKHNKCCDTLTRGYSWFLAKCPYVPIILTFVLLVAVTWSSYHYYPPPDFSEDPSKGFETRGTYLSKAQSTMMRLRRDIMRQRTLTYRPDRSQLARTLGISEELLDHYLPPMWGSGDTKDDTGHTQDDNGDTQDDTGDTQDDTRDTQDDTGDTQDDNGHTQDDNGDTQDGTGDTQDDTGDTEDNIRDRRALGVIQRVKRHAPPLRDKRQYPSDSNCQCDHPKCLLQLPIFVFEPVNKEKDLFTVDAMHSMCKYQDDLIYPKTEDVGLVYCEAISVPNIIAKISRKHCKDITQVDLDYTRNLIETCGKYVYNNLTREALKHVPSLCSIYNRQYVTDILINVAQVGFLNAQTQKLEKLKYAATYMSGFYSKEVEFYYNNFEGRTVRDNEVKISAVKFSNHYNVKWDLLGNYLISDLLYFGVALGLVFFIMFVYLRSIVLMFTTLLNVNVSFVTAYFIYYFVCRMTFFPYLNLLAGLVLIAVGADDMFIFYDCWEQAKAEDPTAPIPSILDKTLRHAALSVFVTSLTTSSAFFANALSNITAIQDFAIFAGICILVNLFYMITLTPAVIVTIEWFYRLYMKSSTFQAWDAKVDKITQKLHELSVVIFHRIFPVIIDKTWFLWIFLLFMQGLGACIVVFVYPKFELPNSKDFQLFPSSNVIENWDLTMGTKFESAILNDADSDDRIKFLLLFGIHADDPGNHLDPNDKGEDIPPVLDTTFDLAEAETQVFIYNTCHELLKQPFMPDHVVVTCQLDAILEMLKLYCTNPLVQMSGCCPKNMAIPIEAGMFRRCAAAYQLLLYQTERGNSTSLNFGFILGDILFTRNDSSAVAYGIFVRTDFIPTFAHEEMAEYNKVVMDFVNKQLPTGPKGVHSGFVAYTDWFWFYDLQLALATGTFYSIILSLCVAFVVMLVTSQNLLITVYAMITICFAISCTVAVLVFLGWQLNIIESLIISLAVGLSIDFTIHFGVAYRISKAETSRGRAEEGFRTVGAAVAMAALTTFLAGVAVMPCQVLIYIKLGIFLMLVMTFSWLYSNFFFQSVCHIIGPSRQCYASCARLCCCCCNCLKINTSGDSLI